MKSMCFTFNGAATSGLLPVHDNRLHKHTSTMSTPKVGNFKTYLVDLAVRNAVMKLSQAQMVADPSLMGAYAENVVANHLRGWPGLVELGYLAA